MKDNIHPKYVESVITCACGTIYETMSIKPDIRVEICSNCHPLFTGKEKFVDTAGRIDRFKKKYSGTRKRKKANKK